MPRNAGHLLLLGSMYSFSTSVLRLRRCALSCAPCTMPSVPVCVCLTLRLACSPVFSASRHHPDPQRQPLCPSLLSHSLRPWKEDRWLRAELRSRACGSALGHARTQHPRHMVRNCLNVSPLFLSTGGSRCEMCESDARGTYRRSLGLKSVLGKGP